MSGAAGRSRPGRIERLVSEAEGLESDLLGLQAHIEILVRTQRSLVPCGATPWAVSTVRKISELVAAGQQARNDLVHAHNALIFVCRQTHVIGQDGTGPTGGAFRFEPHPARGCITCALPEMAEARYLRWQAEIRLVQMNAALGDGAVTARHVFDRQAIRTFSVLVSRMDGDLAVAVYRRLFARAVSDHARTEAVCDFLVTLADRPEGAQRKLVLGGLFAFLAASLRDRLAGRPRRDALSDDIYRIVAEED